MARGKVRWGIYQRTGWWMDGWMDWCAVLAGGWVMLVHKHAAMDRQLEKEGNRTARRGDG